MSIERHSVPREFSRTQRLTRFETSLSDYYPEYRRVAQAIPSSATPARGRGADDAAREYPGRV